MQVDTETRFEVTVHHHRGFRIQHGTARQTAANSLINQIRIDAGFSRRVSASDIAAMFSATITG